MISGSLHQKGSISITLRRDDVRNIILPISSKVISLEISQNKIFASTKGNGIFVFNREGQILDHIGQNINFSYIREIEGKIWAPSAQGIYTLDVASNQLTLIPNTQKYTFASEPIALADRVFVPHYTGILEIPVYEQGHFDANIMISEASVSGLRLLDTQTIKVNSSNDLVTLKLASLDYRPGHEKQFQYRVNNQAWQNVSGTQISLTGLASGNYRISVRGTNSLGQWSTNEAFTHIKVAFPWYWTPKIRIMYAALGFCLVAFVLWLLYLRAQSIKTIHSIFI